MARLDIVPRTSRSGVHAAGSGNQLAAARKGKNYENESVPHVHVHRCDDPARHNSGDSRSVRRARH